MWKKHALWIVPYLCGCALGWADEPKAGSVAFFETHIRPVLVERCYKCHSTKSDELQGGLALDSEFGWQTGGDSGTAIVQRDSERSLLMAAISYAGPKMPPDGRMPAAIVERFRQWIEAGAVAPSGEKLASQSKKSVDLARGRQFWAFQTPRASAVPSTRDPSWPLSSIDAFLANELQSAGVKPVESASAETVLRRLSFDLTGLPPDVELLQACSEDPSHEHWQRIVDRLLASQGFAEHWARHWLDVVRYSDGNGSDFNATYHNAWRYRNWVVRALADDLPFDRFVRMQIAGDLLPAANESERMDNLVATGFLMMGPKMLSERNKDKLRMDVVDEQIDAVGRSFLGLTLGCARCHDHKFDPIPTEDYYALAGFFRSTRTLHGESQKYVSSWMETPLPADSELFARNETYKKEHDRLSAAVRDAQKKLDQLITLSKKPSEVLASATGSERPPEPRRHSGQVTLAANSPLADTQTAEKTLKDAQEQLKRHDATKPPPLPSAFATCDLPTNEIGDAFVCVRGEVANRGATVPRGFLQVCSIAKPEIPPTQSGRVELAKWLTDPENPLIARVIVNRIWAQLTGSGLVRTLDDFGSQGERPTHPQLLDTLAVEFIRDGWSVQRLVRRIVTSRFYQLSTRANAAALELDPDNRLYGRANRRRIPVEALRDTLLLRAGVLDRSVGYDTMAGFGTLVDKNTGETSVKLNASSRRSLYEPVVRNYLSPLQVAFDFADPDLIVGQRPTTNTPSQALVLLNSPDIVAFIKQISEFFHRTATDSDDQIQELFAELLARTPCDEERAVIRELLVRQPGSAGLEAAIHAIVASTPFRFLD